ncbi:MAG: hypothetical protein LQ342_006036 [Letrouitia transgressa]|nr:MAG: hypothetical protein LQ342_006036 [Letrouitia transgressa]
MPPFRKRRHAKPSDPFALPQKESKAVRNYLSTPDRREGWADYFLKRGYVVYLTDPPQRGRSPWIPGEGFVEAVPVDYVLRFFTTAQKYKLWPQAYLNAQWPGTGLPGDPIFDEFYRSQVQLQLNASLSDVLNKPADEALLDRIGPAVVVTHSQSGPYGWVIGDSRPNLVKGIIAVEPEGPPFVNETGPTGPARYDGITRLPLKYDPPVVDPFTDLKTEVIPPAGPNLTSCTQQKAPVKKLVNLSKVPVLLLTGEASYHAPYDYCMVRYLRQVGINVRWLDLGAVGIHGNGHFLFMEKNNRKIAGLVGKWLREVVEKH